MRRADLDQQTRLRNLLRMMHGKPLVIDGYCGLGGWSEGFLAQGWECVGFDIERHDYGNGSYPGHLILQDMLTVHGKQFKDAECLVFSPPCQEFSYMGMPWSRAKAIAAEYRSGKRDVKKLTALFDACFRIQREAIEAAGHFIPMVVENVRGAQPWVGKARWNFGSFYLWGDVPALMPIPAKLIGDSVKAGDRNINGKWTSSFDDSLKLPGNNGPRRWDEREVKRLCDATKVPSESGRRTDIGNGARFTSRDCGIDGSKNMSGLRGFSHPTSPNETDLGGQNDPRRFNSKSKSRKAASAAIAKIPLALASWVAKVYKPK